MTKKVAAILTIAGGVFYIIGGLLGLGGLFVGILRIGLVAGPVIMIGGVLVTSKSRKVRMTGGVLAIFGIVFAALYLCGGLLAGLILTLVGSISGIRYKEPILVQRTLPSRAPRQAGVGFTRRDH